MSTQEISIGAGETLQSIAQKQLGDFSKWRELADANSLDGISDLVAGSSLKIPDSIQQIAQKAQPLLGKVASGLNGDAGKIAATIQQTISQISDYATEAQQLLGEVNGIFSDLGETAQSIGTQGNADSARDYQGQAVRLIDWLLEPTGSNANSQGGTNG